MIFVTLTYPAVQNISMSFTQYLFFLVCIKLFKIKFNYFWNNIVTKTSKIEM